MNPFKRRNSKASETYSHVYSPSPQRNQPELASRIERKASSRFKPIPEPDHASRGQMVCPRHGRKLASRSTSSKPGGTPSPEICPDCIAEQDILMREHDAKYGLPNVRGRDETISSGPSSMITERGTPPGDTNNANSLIGTADDHDMVHLPGASIGDPVSDTDSTRILAADLGSMLDAIIIQHSGALDKVITNLREGVSGPKQVQRIAADLSSVAESVAALPSTETTKASTLDSRNQKRTMVLDLNPATLSRRAKSIPQLLDIIDAAAQDWGLSLARDSRAEVNTSETSPTNAGMNDNASPITTSTGASNDSVSSVASSSMPVVTMPSDGRAGPSPTSHASEPGPSESTVPLPPDRITAPPSTSRSAGPEASAPSVSLQPDSLIAPPPASQSSDPEASALVVPSPPEIMTALPSPVSPGRVASPAETCLPSEVLRSMDLGSLPPPELRSASSGDAQSLSAVQPTRSGVEATGPFTPMQSSYRTPISPRSLLSPITAPSYQVSGLNLAPYQGSSGGPRELVKPSEVKKKDQQQRTFEQAWLKEASRASSQREREERKGRMTSFGRGKGEA